MIFLKNIVSSYFRFCNKIQLTAQLYCCYGVIDIQANVS
jgi:hypothetical protein